MPTGKTEKTNTTAAKTNNAVDLEAVKAQIADMLAEAKAEAAKIVAEAKETASKSKSVNVRELSEEEKKQRDYMEEYVEVRLFKDNGKYKDDVFVGVNGENCLIKRGERVKIKRKFAEVLAQSDKQDILTAQLIDEKSGEFAATGL